MKNFIQKGKIVTVAAPATVVAGAGVLVGALFGVAVFGAASGATLEIATEGVFALDKVSAQAWTEGASIYWDNTQKLATTTASGNTPIGVATDAAANPSATGVVKLVPAWPLAVAGLPASAAFAVAAGGSNVSEVTVTVKDAAGNTLAGVHHFDLWLSDAATGLGLTGTSASGTVQAKSGGGTVLAALTAKKALRVQSKADGTFVLEITDTAKTGFYPAASIGGKTVVGAQLVTANYG